MAAAELVPPGPLAPPAAFLAALLGPLAFPDRGGLDDMATTIEAEDQFDLAQCACPVAAQTLIVAGAKDRFYSSELFAETQRLILHARLMLLPRRGHVTALADPRFARAQRSPSSRALQ